MAEATIGGLLHNLVHTMVAMGVIILLDPSDLGILLVLQVAQITDSRFYYIDQPIFLHVCGSDRVAYLFTATGRTLSGMQHGFASALSRSSPACDA